MSEHAQELRFCVVGDSRVCERFNCTHSSTNQTLTSLLAGMPDFVPSFSSGLGEIKSRSACTTSP